MSHLDGIADALRSGYLDALDGTSIEAEGGEYLAKALMASSPEVLERVVLGTATMAGDYDWNVGFILTHVPGPHIAPLLEKHGHALSRSEGICWALGELGDDDPRIVRFLFETVEHTDDVDAWWCAADALEKLGAADAVDLKKRTLQGDEWRDLQHCLENLRERRAVVGVLKGATAFTTKDTILPALREALKARSPRVVQNAIWLIERLGVDDEETILALMDVYERSADHSRTLSPRAVEALGELASSRSRVLLEGAVENARYYRTRAYAARGLGRIGDDRSIGVLQRALGTERHPLVLPHITSAIYSIRHPAKRLLEQTVRNADWPENGMVVDASNKWYANPDVYDRFAQAEDPLGVSLDYLVNLLPTPLETVVELGAGTGRLTMHLAVARPDIASIIAIDGDPAMVDYLASRLEDRSGLSERITPIRTQMVSLPVESDSVDAVVASWAFPSSMFEPATVQEELDEVIRVLRPGGLLVTLGWDEDFADELSEFWYRYVPEPEFRRETLDEWRRRRRDRIESPRNCWLTFVARNLRVPLLFSTPDDAAEVMGYLFGASAGQSVATQQRTEFSINVGVTLDDRDALVDAANRLRSTSQMGG